MALRAGYKGFKKLLPGLKLFRPGTLGIDNDVLIPELNKIFFPRSEQAVFGTVNIFENKASSSGIFTVDDDGVVDVYSATALGSEQKLNLLGIGTRMTIPKGTWYFSCAPEGSSKSTHFVYVDISDADNKYDEGTPVKIISDGSTTIAVEIYIRSGQTPDHIKFKPMLTLANGTQFAPYAMTNKELTENVVGMYIPKILTSSNDIDDIKTNGWYEWEGTIPTNSPVQGWAKMRVLGDESNTQIQIVMNVNQIFIRRFGGNPASWGNWFKFQGTEVTL